MKKIILHFLLLFSLVANAKFIDGIVKFNDGHEEKGLIKSFLEERWFFKQYSKSLEKDLNLDDKFLIFKSSKDAEEKKIFIDDVDQVSLINDDKTLEIFKVIFLKEVNKDGTIASESKKVYLPLLKEGKINIYGFKYLEKDWSAGSYGVSVTRSERFYYQNAKENYAINYGNTDEFLSDILLEKDFWKKVYRRMGDPLKDLFKDCPEMNSKIDIMMEKYISRDKDFEEKEKLLRKEFRKLPRDKQLDLLTIHYYDFNFIDSLISDYQNCK
jgi:hypothetical protein